MKLKSILICLFIACGLALQAQTISVKSFRALPMDMTASSLKGKRIDQNGEVAALIKIVTSQTGFTFEGGTLGIVDTQQRNGEIWVWVPRASRKITILHQQLGVLRDYRYPIEIESERTYEMVLTTGKVETIIKEEVRQGYLVFELEPKNATLEVNDQLWNVEADGKALQYVGFGTYTYRVRAANYNPDAGVVTVDDPDNPKIVKVTLKPNFAEVTFKVDADAEIWVNDEKKGTRTWTGALGKGIYKIECKQAGHDTIMISKEITTEMNGQTITLPAPKPIYGSLNVESSPIGATIYIDGKEVGVTPKPINEILVGQHEIKWVMDGYKTHTEMVTVTKGERKPVKVVLDSNSNTLSPMKTQQSQPQQSVARQEPMGGFFVMANMAYSIAPQTSFGLMVGSVKKFGWYVNFNTNFDFSNSTDYECDDSGQILGSIKDYKFSGEKKTSRLAASAGMMFRIRTSMYAYVGGGYGYRSLLWQFYDSDYNYGWAKNTNCSYKGFALDAGLMQHFGNFAFSIGMQTIEFNYMEAKVGIGFIF